MARKRGKHGQYRPGDEYFLPLTDAERRAHADALTAVHAGHRCAEHAESLCHAGEYYAMLGEHDRAEEVFREALGIEDAEPGSTQAMYASFLLDRNRDDEALALIATVRRLHPENLDVYVMIGEALETNGYPQQAARWFTAGLVSRLGHLADLQGSDLHTDFDVLMLANGRFRVRQTLGLPPDHIDSLVLEERQAAEVLAESG
ncbi:hypothetical protein ABT369_04135 [Dactylosporangium sp. NPDC000244]|uniref:tetratricopeptide repeat protein n=1 Tax=Dactylosporangium sp. NPDC000244 TaxID=3154365 RepID=UPI00332FE89D